MFRDIEISIGKTKGNLSLLLIINSKNGFEDTRFSREFQFEL